MKRAIVSLLLLSVTSAAHAQETRRRVPRGEVTGLEMGIDGALTATPGAALEWFVSVYEVVQRRDLRPAANVTLTATGSHAPGAPLTTVRTDASGRAHLVIPIPADLEHGFHLQVKAESPRRVERTFDVDIALAPRWRVEALVDRESIAPGGEVLFLGRVVGRADGRPIAGEAVTITASQGGARTRADVAAHTDAAGVFWARVPALDAPGQLRVQASTEHGGAGVTVTVAAPSRHPLWTEATPDRRVYAPGDRGRVAVTVRGMDGRPLEGAEIDWDGRDPEVEPLRTGPGGEARVPLDVPAVLDAPWADRALSISVVVPGLGTDRLAVPYRVARVPWVADAVPEGGALVPELDGAVHVRVVQSDGVALAQARLTLDAPRLGGALQATTDDDGVARFSGTLRPGRAPDACGGPTFIAASLRHDGHAQSFCLPVDPDATLTLRGDADGAFVIARRSEVARVPVEVTALVREGDAWHPIARTLVAPGVSRGALALEAIGEVWLRARPLLESGRAVRGGGDLVVRAPDAGALTLSVEAGSARVDGGPSAFVVAVPPARARAARAALQASLSPLAAALDEGRSPGFVAMLAAARTPEDVSATASLREGTVLPQPMPEVPVEHGLLRDPWRTRARFVRGRVGRMLRAVEAYVDAAVPGHLEEVAVRERGGWRFNHAILDAALRRTGTGPEGAVSLDGEPLDAAALASLDRAFTYDAVARRVTRERLFRVHLFLRDLILARGLDRAWALRGDPSTLLVGLLEAEDVPWQHDWPQREHLYDAWGHPLVLRPVRGRARFTFLEPVRDWELVSAGPDGRAGTRDDMVDPFARVLPDGVYAEAVGEETLLARLNGVALGRATAEELAEIFGASDGGSWTEAPEAPRAVALPSPLPITEARAPLPPALQAIGGPADALRWSLPAGRREWVAIAARFDPSGAVRTSERRFEAGAPWTAHLELPESLRPADTLRVPLVLTRFAEGAPPEVVVRSRGAVDARRDGDFVELVARRAGFADVEVIVGPPEAPIGRFSRRLRVVPEGGLRARHAGAIVDDEVTLVAPVPDGATPWRGRLVVGAPSAIASDPRLAGASPAAALWGRAMTGRPVTEGAVTEGAVTGGAVTEGAVTERAGDDALARRLERDAADGLSRPFERACALALWTLEDSNEPARSTLAGALRSDPGASLAERAAVLTALAPAAPAGPASGADAIGHLLARLKRDGWRTLAEATDQPDVMARMAAALLLVDRDDVPGRALLERVQGALRTDDAGRAWVPDAEGRPSWPGTLAGAIAARQAGDDALADRLVRAAATLFHLGARTAEAAFWAIAASVYGGFGVEGPEEVRVTVDGAARTLALTGGVATLDVRAGARVTVRGAAPVWAWIESRYLVPWAEDADAPLGIAIEGVVGALGERAGLELRLEARAEVVDPVLELTLPAGATFDESARRTLEGAPGVTSVRGPDGARVIRLRLTTLPEGAVRRLPLAFRWTAAGESRGFDVAAFSAREPTRIWRSPGRAVPVPEETER